MIGPASSLRERAERNRTVRASLALFILVLLAGSMVVVACAGSSPQSSALTQEKAAELIRRDAKFAEPLIVGGKTIGTRSLVEVTAVTQGVGPGADSGEADVEFTYGWVLDASQSKEALRDALPTQARDEVLGPASHKARARFRRFEDGWHVARYRNVYFG